MKKLFVLICMLFSLSLTSCVIGEYATTQDDLYADSYSDIVRTNVDINIVLTRGVPYYYEGSILYYLYNGLYYYPFYYDNYWYMRVYRRPFDHLRYRPYFRPNRYDYRFHREFQRPQHWRVDPVRPNNRFGNRRPHNSRPDVMPNRPDNRPDNRPNQPNNRQIQPNNRQITPPQRSMQTQPRVTTPSRGNNRGFGGSRSNRR